jgi:IS5 family transposase
MDWQAFVRAFGGLYAENGRPGISTRLMVGLHYLKHAYGVSDEEVVRRWVENPYWQYFCGEEFFQHRLPIDPSGMTRFRHRIGEAGCETLLAMTVDAGLSTKTVKPSSLSRVTVDTTVQEKAIAHPTDARLYDRGRRILVRLAKRHGVELRQTYTRTGKCSLFMHNRYAAAKQLRRAARERRRLRTILGRVYRDLERKLLVHPDPLLPRFAAIMSRVERLLKQQRSDSHKLYSLHAPEVECIAKGKAHKKYEFGVKVGVAATHKDNFVVGMQALPGNPYDGHTLSDALAQVQRLTGVLPRQCFVDRGYRGHGVEGTEVFISGQRRGITASLRKALKRRNAVEPIIGHLKNDGLLGRNHLRGALGDALNAILAGAGHNLRLILRKLRLSWLQILPTLLNWICPAQFQNPIVH